MRDLRKSKTETNELKKLENPSKCWRFIFSVLWTNQMSRSLILVSDFDFFRVFDRFYSFFAR